MSARTDQGRGDVQVILKANPIAITVPANFGTRLEEARTYAEARQLLLTVARKREMEARVSWIYLPLVCERLGDEYERQFWLDQAVRQIPEERTSLLEIIEGRQVSTSNSKVSWTNVLALDLLRREIERLRAKSR